MTNQKEITIPQQFSHSVKINDISRDIRIDVHVYTNDLGTAAHEEMKTDEEE